MGINDSLQKKNQGPYEKFLLKNFLMFIFETERDRA